MVKEQQQDYIPLHLLGKQNSSIFDKIDLSASDNAKFVGDDAYIDIRTMYRIQAIRANILKQLVGLTLESDLLGVTTVDDKKEYTDDEVDNLSFINFFHSKSSNILGNYLKMYSNLVPPPAPPQGIYSIKRLVWKTNSGQTFERHTGDAGYITPKSQHLCARYVRLILTAAGKNPHEVIGSDGNNGVNATDYLSHLPAMGFSKIAELNGRALCDQWTATDGQLGDVAVIPASAKHPYGHICVLTQRLGNKTWVSDFWLNSMCIYNDWQIAILFRYSGQIEEL